MTFKGGLAACALAAGLAVGIPAVAKVSVLQVPSAALARGATYAWAPVSGVAYGVPAPAIVNEIAADRLQAATESALAARGYRRVENPAEADLIIGYRMITAARLDAGLTAGGGLCEPFCRGRSDYRVNASEKTQGTLVLDLVDRRAGRLVYRAISEKEIGAKDASPERLGSLLKQMTKTLPSE